MTKLRLLREGGGCREYVLLNSAVRFSNFVCCFIYFINIIFIFVPLGRYKLVCTGICESMIQENARTITASKRCAVCTLNFRTSLLRLWLDVNFMDKLRGVMLILYRDWEGISGFRPGLQKSDLWFRFSVFRLRTSASNFDVRTLLEMFLNIQRGIETLKRYLDLKRLGFERANKMNESSLEDIAAAIFEPRTTTGSQLFSYLRCFHTTLFILLSIGLLGVTISLKI